MSGLTVHDVRVFVPERDFAVSRAIYQALGWRETWAEDDLALMEIADRRFYLQNHYAKDWAENFMIHLSVEDAGAWKEHVSVLVDSGRFPGARVEGEEQSLYFCDFDDHLFELHTGTLEQRLERYSGDAP